MSWVFVTSCVDSTAELIDAMTASATQVSYRTMHREVGRQFVLKQHELGYDVGNMRDTGLRMKRDWHVSYWRGTYDGRACYYFVWSHIEYVFCRRR